MELVVPEILLHYIWQRELFRSFPQATTDGRRIEVISVGHHNFDAGPDFDNAHIRIYNPDNSYEDWVGNVEIHVRSSEWNTHHHQLDPRYDNVILHVVRDADKTIYNSRGRALVQCELQYPDEQDYLSRLIADAHAMDTPFATHRCGKWLKQTPELITIGWKQTMLNQRLECKKQSIERLLTLTNHNWEHAFYISLAHYFGFHTNGIPFEQLAIITPLIYLQKHRDNLDQVTAMLLGQSGLITPSDPLFREYDFLRKKFSLTPMDPSLWKHGRIRPQNAPELRIRQFALLIHKSEFLFSKLMETTDIDALRSLLMVDTIGRASVDILLINTVIPYLYARSRTQQALDLLRALPPEDNRIIRQWRELGQRIENAADTQALIHLFQTGCQNAKCLNCDVAYQIFLTLSA